MTASTATCGCDISGYRGGRATPHHSYLWLVSAAYPQSISLAMWIGRRHLLMVGAVGGGPTAPIPTDIRIARWRIKKVPGPRNFSRKFVQLGGG